MGLPPRPARGGEGGRLAQHLGRAGDREPWRDGVAQPAVVGAVPAPDEVGRLAQRALQDGRRLDDRVVRASIHHHLAEDRPDAVGLGRAERDVHRRLEDHAVGEDGRGAGRREGLEDGRRKALRDRWIRPRLLGREGDAVEPGQEVEREPDAGVGHLRQMRVEVDHAWHDDPGPKVRGVGRLIRSLRRRPGEGEPPGGVHDDQSVGLVKRPALRERGQQSRPDRERWRTRGFHRDRLAGRWPRSTQVGTERGDSRECCRRAADDGTRPGSE